MNVSLPSWERGLKLVVLSRYRVRIRVAPFVGAWIEIMDLSFWSVAFAVAPFVGAWIEIFAIRGSTFPSKVAPFVGAWIEINVPGSDKRSIASLPSWERGLKSLPLRRK